jgi:hypothetical protein
LWVLAAGSDPLSYQWKKGGVDVPGANTPFFEIDSASTGDAGNYTVEVSNPGGSVTSNAASVSVNAFVSSQITSISTRAMEGTGGSILIPGIFISGTDPRELLLRAVGPGLEQHGVVG